MSKGKNKKSDLINERWIRWTNHEKTCWIDSKNIYLKGNNNEDQKAKGTKKGVMKRKFRFQNYQNCLEQAQIENKIKHSEKNKVDADSLKEYQNEFIKDNKLIIKTQQRFRSEKHNVFTDCFKLKQ